MEDNIEVISVSSSLKFLQAHVMVRRCYLLTFIYLPCFIVEFLYHNVKVNFCTYYGIYSAKVYVLFFFNKMELMHKFWKKFCSYVKVLPGYNKDKDTIFT
jgi:hypothetical protein